MSFFKNIFWDSPTDCIEEGKAYFEQGLYYDAIESLDEALRLDPKSAEAYLQRGLAHQQEDEFDEAIADFTAAVRLDPRRADAYLHRGDAYLAMDEFDQAIPDYDRAIRQNPAFVERIATEVLLIWKKVKPPRAKKLDKASELDPTIVF